MLVRPLIGRSNERLQEDKNRAVGGNEKKNKKLHEVELKLLEEFCLSFALCGATSSNWGDGVKSGGGGGGGVEATFTETDESTRQIWL